MRPGRSFIIFFLIVAVVVIALATFIFLREDKLPEPDTREIVKEFTFLSPDSLDDWDENIFAKTKTVYSLIDDNGKGAVKGVSDDSASALYYKQKLSHKRYPFVSWDWKVEKFPTLKNGGSLDKKSEFDFAAQLYVVFHARFFLNMKAIQYVWTESIPVGTISISPYTKKVRVMVLRSGTPGEWKHEDRNIKEDYEALFGEPVEKDIAAVSFMTDSDSGDSRAIAYFTNITMGYYKDAGKGPSGIQNANGEPQENSSSWGLFIDRLKQKQESLFVMGKDNNS